LDAFEMGLNKINYSVLFGWEIIANVRRWATCAASSCLKLMKYTYCSMHSIRDQIRSIWKKLAIL